MTSHYSHAPLPPRTSLLSRVRWYIMFGHVEPFEIWLALMAFSWGLWLANPTFDVLNALPALSDRMRVLPEWLWGTSLASAGMLSFVGVVAGDLRLRQWSQMVLMVLWSIVSGTLIAQEWRWTSTIIYPFLALASLIVHFRLGVDALYLRRSTDSE